MTSGCTEFREIAWDAMVCVYTDGQDQITPFRRANLDFTNNAG